MKQLSIIGLSNAGKTCYIYAMAKTMIKGYNGLNAIAIDDNLRDQYVKDGCGSRKVCNGQMELILIQIASSIVP